MDKQIAIIFKLISLLKLPLMCCCTCMPQMYVLRRKKKHRLYLLPTCAFIATAQILTYVRLCALARSLSLHINICLLVHHGRILSAQKKERFTHSFIFHWHMSAHLYLECMRTKSRSIYETKQWNKWMRENPKRTRRKLLLSACMWDKRESNSKLKS